MAVRIHLQRLLDEKDISQRKLAELTGIKQPTINKMCQNTLLHFPLDSLEKICIVLECEITDILELKKEQTE
ncbi:helix-turn-helix transcriptional regulator [Sporosarcina sp. FSL K6-6792]|uniref:helix-turn-helix domain-containing protein n=1 Tax=Sporosarcina sp. FSL K6-6792 TaxID=2921559 RepID=UPI0030FBB52B